MTKNDRFGFATAETRQSRYVMARSEYERVRQAWETYLRQPPGYTFGDVAVTFEDNYGAVLTVALKYIEAVADYPAKACQEAREEERAESLTDGDAGIAE